MLFFDIRKHSYKYLQKYKKMSWHSWNYKKKVVILHDFCKRPFYSEGHINKIEHT